MQLGTGGRTQKAEPVEGFQLKGQPLKLVDIDVQVVLA